MKTTGLYIVPLCLALAACSNGSRDSSVHTMPDTQTANAGPLQSWCAQCHAPPSPLLHKRNEWPAVVRRMAHHRMDARMPAIPAEAEKKLGAWLQKHAQP